MLTASPSVMCEGTACRPGSLTVFVFTAFLLLTGGNARAQGTVATDRAALVALYNATGGAGGALQRDRRRELDGQHELDEQRAAHRLVRCCHGCKRARYETLSLRGCQGRSKTRPLRRRESRPIQGWWKL